MTTHEPPKRILIVEDELDMRYFLKTLLETSGYSVMIANNGQDGFAMVTADKPDLIILDVMMPKQGGAVMYQKLKHDPDFDAIPVIMLSAVSRTSFQHFLKMLKLKADGKVPEPQAYVEKPPDPRNLLHLIKQFV